VTNRSAKKVSDIPTPPTASRCVLLKNMFNPAEETGDSWVTDLEEDVKAECENKYGKVHSPYFKTQLVCRLRISMWKKTRKVKSISSSIRSVPAKLPFKV
jgi:hypothetical protein